MNSIRFIILTVKQVPLQAVILSLASPVLGRCLPIQLLEQTLSQFVLVPPFFAVTEAHYEI